MALVNPQLTLNTEPRAADGPDTAGAAPPSPPGPQAAPNSAPRAWRSNSRTRSSSARAKPELPAAADFDLRPLLDLVALGTVADIVPLTGENRICRLGRAGPIKHNSAARPRRAQKRGPNPLPAGHVLRSGFRLGPRLNAAGRLETTEEALRLLLAGDLAEAMPIARNLDSQNRERQKIERGIVEQVVGGLRDTFNPDIDLVIVEGRLLWHIGVLGIVASRVMQEFYRPTIKSSAGKETNGAARAADISGLRPRRRAAGMQRSSGDGTEGMRWRPG